MITARVLWAISGVCGAYTVILASLAAFGPDKYSEQGIYWVMPLIITVGFILFGVFIARMAEAEEA